MFSELREVDASSTHFYDASKRQDWEVQVVASMFTKNDSTFQLMLATFDLDNFENACYDQGFHWGLIRWEVRREEYQCDGDLPSYKSRVVQ